MSAPPRGASFARVQGYLAVGALLTVAASAWAFLVAMERAMVSMRGDGLAGALMLLMMTPGAAGPYLAASAVMWLAMMVAMMVPAALPLMLVFRGLERGPGAGADPLLFVCGYLATWSVFALLAAGGQWALHLAGWLHGARLAVGAPLAGGLLIVAGQVGIAPDGTIPEDAPTQIDFAFRRLGAILEHEGLAFDDLVDLTSYHVRLDEQLQAFREVKDRYIVRDFPAWTIVGVAALARPSLLVEIKAVAALRA